jgi:2-oxo-4-hydroxy-4-carboxy-5-ureidoimidazoline decarboxylase
LALPPLDLTVDDLREGRRVCLPVPRRVEDVVGQAPYGSLAELLAVARAAASPLSAAEVDQALAEHPRIGERAAGEGRSQAFSRAEQRDSASDDPQLAAALAAGNEAYERKFSRVFLIRAAGRSRPEILAELNRRLQLDSETELGVVASELRDIALLRIPQLFGHRDHHFRNDDSEAAQ